MRLIGLGVVLAVGLALAPLAAEGQHATTGLALHQAVTASVGLADPARFERLERPTEEGDVYVERTPALVLRPDEITTVVVTREPVYADTASMIEVFRRRHGLPGQPQPIRITSYYYWATIHVDVQAARRVHTFTANNVGQRVDVRFNGTRLAVPKILDPLPSGQIPIGLTKWSRAQIEQVFAVLKTKMTWKADEPVVGDK
jgi:hypothetical protein